ncbi:hypothetical protein MACH26_12970 [Planctobacterium marinum]|uniref:Uncharacterized protein n=1 Tax=Planctobacterium marinum TaxID=1631968 RepID=A0AA48KNQ3_9ALTE|nr:hypothetical protein MACH26_12970 [Planctobacterium marinum]
MLCFHLSAWAADKKIFSFPVHNIDSLKPIEDSVYWAQRMYYQLRYGEVISTVIPLSVDINRLNEFEQAQMRYILEFWDGQSETFSNEIYHFKVEHGSSGGDYRVEVKNHHV